MQNVAVRETVADFVKSNKGILPLRPAMVAKDFLLPGKRLSLPDEKMYDCGKRGKICERWLCSVTDHDSLYDVKDDGQSFLEMEGEPLTVRDAIEAYPEIIGLEYHKKHKSLDRLIKLFDYGDRLPFHIHQMQKDLNTQGKTSKDEAYHFLDAAPGPHPETFIGVHPSLVRHNLQYEAFLPILKEWKGSDNEVLRFSQAYQDVPGEGFFLKSGILHAPGSVLTFELQESSDVAGIFQPLIDGKYPIDKHSLLKDVAKEEQEKWGPEMAALRQVDWEANIDPDFYDKYHLFPRKCLDTVQDDLYETWIFYGTRKFSGKRLILPPGRTFHTKEAGVHNLFIWKGRGMVGEKEIVAKKVDLVSCQDELLVCHDRAVAGYDIRNTGSEPMWIYKIFGPDINNGKTPDIDPVGK